jgi:hypothetical protein
MSISRRWRGYPRVSVRALIVVVLFVGGWFGWAVRSARSERDAVTAIKNVGGRVVYDWEQKVGKSIPGGNPWAPRWLTDRIGVDYFGHVVKVSVSSSETAGDAAIEPVGRLGQVEHLTIQLSNLSSRSAGLRSRTMGSSILRTCPTLQSSTSAGLKSPTPDWCI